MTQSAPHSSRSLLRVLGAGFGIAMVLGATIGGGILHAPGDVATALPAAGLFLAAWILGAINALLGATAFAELGAMIPRSGGIYTFVHRAFGDTAGLAAGYADWINWSISAAALMLLAGEYLGGLFAPLAGHAAIGGMLTLAFLCLLQWRGVRTGGRAQEITTLLKCLAFAVLIVAGLTSGKRLPPATTAHVVPHGLALWIAFGAAMQYVVFTYDSYYAVVYTGSEVRDPGRNIPRSIFQGTALVCIVFLAINLAYLRLVPVTRIAGDPFVGATIATMIFGPRGDSLMRIIMIVSVMGTANAQLMASPRVLHAMATDGLAPVALRRVNAGGTPVTGLVITVVLAGLFLFSGSFAAAINIVSFFVLGLYVATFASVFRLRRREPTAPRPYRAWGYPWTPALACLIALLVLIALGVSDPKSGIFAAVFVLAMVVVAWLRRNNRLAGS